MTPSAARRLAELVVAEHNPVSVTVAVAEMRRIVPHMTRADACEAIAGALTAGTIQYAPAPDHPGTLVAGHLRAQPHYQLACVRRMP